MEKYMQRCILFILISLFYVTGSYSECPNKSWFPWKERCYFIAPSPGIYTHAKAGCDQLGASLAVPNSKEENDFIRTITAAYSLLNSSTVSYMYLGCERYTYASSKWYGVDGFYLGVHDVAANIHEPNMYNLWDSPQQSSTKETSVIMATKKTSGNTLGLWHDARPTSLCGSVCERAARPRKTILVHTGDVQGNTIVSFPLPDANYTEVKSTIACFYICSYEVTCKAINFNRKSGVCKVFLESLWIFNFVSETGWSYIEA